MADIDGILERLVTDQGFRTQLSSDPATALAGYDLSADDLALLASSMDEGDTGQRGVEQRTSKSAVVGLLASLTGGGHGSGHGGGGKAHASDIFAKTGGTDQGNLVAPGGKGGSAEASDIFAKLGDRNSGNLIAPGGGDPSHAAVDMFAPRGADPSHAAVDMFAPADISGNAPADVNGGSAAIGDIKGVGNTGPAMDAPNLKIGPVTDAGNLKIGPASDLSPAQVQGNFSPEETLPPSGSGAGLNGDEAAIAGVKMEVPVDPSNILGNTAPADDGSKGILIGLNQGDAGVNGDGSPAELIGLLQPPTGDSAKGIGVHTIKMGEAVDAFLEIDDA